MVLSTRLMSGIVCPPPLTQKHIRTKLVDDVLVVTLDTPNAKVNGVIFFFFCSSENEVSMANTYVIFMIALLSCSGELTRIRVVCRIRKDCARHWDEPGNSVGGVDLGETGVFCCRCGHFNDWKMQNGRWSHETLSQWTIVDGSYGKRELIFLFFFFFYSFGFCYFFAYHLILIECALCSRNKNTKFSYRILEQKTIRRRNQWRLLGWWTGVGAGLSLSYRNER